MYNFLIQTNKKKEIMFDFQYVLLEQIKFINWYNNEKIHKYKYITIEEVSKFKNKKNIIPVGSLEFVFNFLENIPKPINIPKELKIQEFLNRNIYIETKDSIVLNENLKDNFFIKSNTKYKSFTEIINKKNIIDIPVDEFLISDIVEFQSEWRYFIHNKNIIDFKIYSGNPYILPEKEIIEKMIVLYHNSPKAYTLDIGIINGKTSIIEVHPFVSCGLYGFNSNKIINMFIDGYKSLGGFYETI